MVEEQAVLEIISMDHFKLAAAGIKRLAVGGKGKPVKRLIQNHPANDLLSRFVRVENSHFMGAISSMENGEPAAGGMHRDIDGKISQSHLLPGRAKRPLIGQLNGAAGKDSRQNSRRSCGLGLDSGLDRPGVRDLLSVRVSALDPRDARARANQEYKKQD